MRGIATTLKGQGRKRSEIVNPELPSPEENRFMPTNVCRYSHQYGYQVDVFVPGGTHRNKTSRQIRLARFDLHTARFSFKYLAEEAARDTLSQG